MVQKANGNPRSVILLAVALNKYHHKTLVNWSGPTDIGLRTTGPVSPKAQIQLWDLVLKMFQDRKPMAGEGMKEYGVGLYPESRPKGNMSHAKRGTGCYPTLAAHVKRKPSRQS